MVFFLDWTNKGTVKKKFVAKDSYPFQVKFRSITHNYTNRYIDFYRTGDILIFSFFFSKTKINLTPGD